MGFNVVIGGYMSIKRVAHSIEGDMWVPAQVTACLVSAPEPIVCSVCVCACGPVLHARRCVSLTG